VSETLTGILPQNWLPSSGSVKLSDLAGNISEVNLGDGERHGVLLPGLRSLNLTLSAD
jgi:hypothetical protein